MESYSSILLIDDDPINNLINKRLIAKLEIGDKIEVFLEAEKAIDRIHAFDSDKSVLIFLDINMPVMNGWDFLYRYLNQFEKRKDTIVVLSSSIDIQDKNRAREFSCVEGFIEKPLSPEKIKNLLS